FSSINRGRNPNRKISPSEIQRELQRRVSDFKFFEFLIAESRESEPLCREGEESKRERGERKKREQRKKKKEREIWVYWVLGFVS
nr:hypothetical protein [Candidatus Liberibacter asiaticus]